ncbi:MAG: hypothetical protein ABIO05_06070 [Ferruginibacter sp.]
MKKLLIAGSAVLLLSGCFVFKKKEKLGCKTGRNIGAERIASGDPKALKANKAKFKGGNGKTY